MVSNLILVFTRPAGLSLIAVIVAFVLNLAVSAVTIALATPVYARIKQGGEVVMAWYRDDYLVPGEG